MFEDSLFASNSVSNPRRGWTAFVSFLIQTFFIGILVALPLLFTQALPLAHWTDYLTVPPAQAPASSEAPIHQSTRPRESNLAGTVMLQPPNIPNHIARVVDDGPAPELGLPNGVIGSPNPATNTGPIMRDLLNATRPPVIAVITGPTKPVLISTGVSQGLLLRQVKPVYPPICIKGRIQGDVILQAIIGKDGTIQNLRAVSGHPMLIKAAMDAVQQWRYRPYMLNGEPVDVETQVRVSFTIS